jgi:hypothetical protein
MLRNTIGIAVLLALALLVAEMRPAAAQGQPVSPTKTQIEASDAVRQRIDQYFLLAVNDHKNACDQTKYEEHVHQLEYFSEEAGINTSAFRDFGPVAFSEDFMSSLKGYAKSRLAEFKKICGRPAGESTTASGAVRTPPISTTQKTSDRDATSSEREDARNTTMTAVDNKFREGVTHRDGKDCLGFLEAVKALEEGRTTQAAWDELGGKGVDIGSLPPELVNYAKSRARDLRGLWQDCPQLTTTTSTSTATGVKGPTNNSGGVPYIGGGPVTYLLEGGKPITIGDDPDGRRWISTDQGKTKQYFQQQSGVSVPGSTGVDSMPGANTKSIQQPGANLMQKGITNVPMQQGAKQAPGGAATKGASQATRRASQPAGSQAKGISSQGPLQDNALGQQLMHGLIQGGIQYGIGRAMGGGGGQSHPQNAPSSAKGGHVAKPQGTTAVKPGAAGAAPSGGVMFYGVTGPSDARLKRDVRPLARHDSGVMLYRFRYLWSDTEYVGVMAQEVALIRPDAVLRGADGFLRVDYGKLGLLLVTWNEWRGLSGEVGEHAAVSAMHASRDLPRP